MVSRLDIKKTGMETFCNIINTLVWTVPFDCCGKQKNCRSNAFLSFDDSVGENKNCEHAFFENDEHARIFC